jgi:hypothetical protein
MNQLEYVSAVASAVHEEIEGWARNLLRDAGIETTEVYGQFPPEGSVASHIVLFPYRIGTGDSQLSQPVRETSLLGKRAANSQGSVPHLWFEIGQLITKCIDTSYPKMSKGPFRGRPHPAPSVDLLPPPLKEWYLAQGDSGKGDSWLTDIRGRKFARLPSLSWKGGLVLRFQYLVVVGEGARGTAERTAPIAVRALSVFTAGAQMQRTLEVRIPPIPFAPMIPSYLEAVAASLPEEEDQLVLQKAIKQLSRQITTQITLLPGSNLSNSDFTGLMQALQRPLQPTINLAIQLRVDGGPCLEPGINVDIQTDSKDQRDG